MKALVSSTLPLAALALVGAVLQAQTLPASSDAARENTQTTTTPAGGSPRGVSQVRIVRLSEVKGIVKLDRNTGRSFEEAFVNLPIVAGVRLQTLDGLAEVEFEDNSSLRLTPNSLVEFPVLARDATGATITTVRLLSGGLYVSRADGKAPDGFTISAGSKTIMPPPSSHLRLEFTEPTEKLVVFKGDVTVTDPSGTVTVDKKKSATFNTATGAPPVYAHTDGDAVFDKWDKNEVDYHKARAGASTFAASTPYAYGTSDLGYYGSFADLGGCGSMWRPYLATAAWDPYGSGVWSWYPGQGYSWVSPYPWGWTPYHSGSWEYCAGSSSWGWRPQGAWRGLQNHPALIAVHGPVRPLPPAAPRAGQPTLVGVNLKPMPVSQVEASGAFSFRSDSAGMGVPRGVFNNLGKISQNVSQHGVATTTLSDTQVQRAMLAPSNVAAAHVGVASTAAARNSGSMSSASMSASNSHISSAGAGASRGGSSGSGAGAGGGGGSHH